ncbi:MAG: peptidylprolyl isomerase [Patescibacteria group bacterium]
MSQTPESPKIRHHVPVERRRQAVWIAGGVFLAIVAVFGFGLYRYGWKGGVTQVVTQVLPYPAAIVEGRIIRYSEYREDLAVLERFYEAERGRAAAGSVFPTQEELKKRVLDRLIKDELAYALAERYGAVVSSDDVKETYDATILEQSSIETAGGKARAEARAAETLENLYGLRPSQFKTRVLHPFLVRQKLEAAIREDEALNVEKRKKAEAAAKELGSGKAFKDVALAYSEDPSVTANGGDRGMIGRGLLAPEVEISAFALEDGGTSGVVKSAFGYHVLRVTDRQDSDGETTKVHLHEILVHPIQLDDYLEAQKKTASIIIFVQ